jgi:hypothetical protein
MQRGYPPTVVAALQYLCHYDWAWAAWNDSRLVKQKTFTATARGLLRSRREGEKERRKEGRNEGRKRKRKGGRYIERTKGRYIERKGGRKAGTPGVSSVTRARQQR